jgi:kynureninase
MLTVRVARDAQKLAEALATRGAICDFRNPDILRFTPAPLYNSFEDVQRLGALLRELVTHG